jgi:hypothetical protein
VLKGNKVPVLDKQQENCHPATHRSTSPKTTTLGRCVNEARTFLLAWWHRKDLNQLAVLFGTDKWGHWYTEHYQRFFSGLRNKRLNILEIGVGGYANPLLGGRSLRMWKAYFRRSRIVGIDIFDKSSLLLESRIDIRQCDQTDPKALQRLSEEYDGFDVIIDDGSHLNADVIKSFGILFPLMRNQGIYAIEDTQTSYWQAWGGGIGSVGSSMSFFKDLVDGLNHVEFPVLDYNPNYFERHIVQITFFHNLVLIFKGLNTESTSAPGIVEREIKSRNTEFTRR